MNSQPAFKKLHSFYLFAITVKICTHSSSRCGLYDHGIIRGWSNSRATYRMRCFGHVMAGASASVRSLQLWAISVISGLSILRKHPILTDSHRTVLRNCSSFLRQLISLCKYSISFSFILRRTWACAEIKGHQRNHSEVNKSIRSRMSVLYELSDMSLHFCFIAKTTNLLLKVVMQQTIDQFLSKLFVVTCSSQYILSLVSSEHWSAMADCTWLISSFKRAFKSCRVEKLINTNIFMDFYGWCIIPWQNSKKSRIKHLWACVVKVNVIVCPLTSILHGELQCGL